jgi:peptidase S46-like protein
MKTFLYLSICFLLLGAALVADEGMWLFNAFPTAKVKTTYGFEPTQAWLDHVRLSSAKFSNGSGSFVSGDGLTFTNHHIGLDCLHNLSSAGRDYVKTGFYAKSQAEEGKCPNLEVNVLAGIEDVTAKVTAAAAPGMSTAQVGQAQRAAMSAIEQACSTGGLRCDVITLYAGGMYHLYKYRKYTDVRLVFAPEVDIAFFGGDPDNFEFPRYDLDITFFRVYENGKPAHIEHHFTWSKAGVKEGEPVFVSGHPGSTGRMLTVAQMQFLRERQYPWQLKSYKQRIAALKDFSRQSAENARIAQEDIFSLENAQKAIGGYQAGLLDMSLMASKAAHEKKLQQFVASSSKKASESSDPWRPIETAMKAQREIFLPLTYLERRGGFRGTLAGIARDLVRVAAEKPKPNGDRLREYRDSTLPSLEQRLFSTAPVYKSLESNLLAESLAEIRDELGADNPTVMRVLGAKSPEARAKEIIAGTKLEDVSVRKQLYQGGGGAVQASRDPLIELMRMIDPEARAARKRYDDEVEAVEREQGAALAKIVFAAEGSNMPPDATSTLRLSYGAVRGFVEDGRGIVPAGTKVPFFTTIGGAFEHANQHGNKDPYQLPETWTKAKSRLRLETPLNMISTPDIIGGNSGSPVINTKAEIVGIIFDGNIQSLPWRFAYEDKIGRSISVDARGIIEALRSIYGANALVDELTAAPVTSSTRGAAR